MDPVELIHLCTITLTTHIHIIAFRVLSLFADIAVGVYDVQFQEM